MQFSLLIDGKTTGTLNVPGFTPASEDERFVQVYQVGPQFFATLGMSIVEGRDFTDEDMIATPQPIALNETAARRYFPGTSAVGRMVGTAPHQSRIIAVVRDARYNTLRDQSAAVEFYPYSRAGRGRMTFAVKVASEASGTQTIERVIRELDPLVPAQMTTLDAVVSRSLGQERAAGGDCGVLRRHRAAPAVARTLRRHGVLGERAHIGNRRAHGARGSAIARRPGCAAAAADLRAGGHRSSGSASRLLGSRLIASFLFGLSPQDPLTILGAALLLVAVACVAGVIPARRASRVDPVVALRCE